VIDQRALKKAYKEARRPMGVFAVRNRTNGKVFLGGSQDLPGALNRHRFQLRMGSHQNRALQADWNRLGEEAFEVEIMDELKPKEGAPADPARELAVLLELWMEKLQPWAERGYHQEPRST
jgi:hypothetical protein